MSNFLDLQCPKCGDDSHIRIAAMTWLDVTSDGTSADNSDHEYERTSVAMCCACDFSGLVADFEQEA